MSNTEQLITEHIDIWTSAVLAKSTAGRGSNKKYELYGIKKLRELIMELAVRGKLVPQDPNDEPASVLLERISTEKAALVKEGKIKKQKPLPIINKAEKVFTIPKGWEWTNFGDIYPLDYGNNLPKAKRSNTGEFKVYGSNGVVGTHNENCVSSPCIIVGRKGSAGALNLCLESGCWVTDVAYSCTPAQGIYLQFAFLQLHTLGLSNLGKGIKPGLNRNEAYVLPVALPPVAEQQRIVAKVDELMELCDQLEQQTEASIDAHATLVEVLLTTLTDSADAEELAKNWARISVHFDALFTTDQSIEALKQTILQLAVMGKLVPQDPNDEPASVLLNQLRKERNSRLHSEIKENPECKTMLKKLKKLGVSTPPFTLPSSWISAHLIDLTKFLVDCHNKTAPYVANGIPIIRTSNIRHREFSMVDMKYINEETYEYWSRRCPPEPGDIIFTREAPMGEAAIIPENCVWCLGQRTMLIRPVHTYISNKYLLLALTEPHLLERASEHAIGSTVKHLRVGDVERLNIPLPPLAEQQRIVAKVDELMEICDQLKGQLQQSREIQLQLTDALIEKALG